MYSRCHFQGAKMKWFVVMFAERRTSTVMCNRANGSGGTPVLSCYIITGHCSSVSPHWMVVYQLLMSPTATWVRQSPSLNYCTISRTIDCQSHANNTPDPGVRRVRFLSIITQRHVAGKHQAYFTDVINSEFNCCNVLHCHNCFMFKLREFFCWLLTYQKWTGMGE